MFDKLIKIKKSDMKKCLLISLLVMITLISFATVKPNTLFSDNMVLQRGVLVPVWGTANDGEKVTVEFNGQKVSTVAKGGKWKVNLKVLKANSKPQPMTITGENTIKIENILVGEVWVCSGQSNMEMLIASAIPKPIFNVKEEIAAANYPEIRQFRVARNASDTMVEDANSKWVSCNPVSVKNFTAVGYFFARDLFKHLNIPIGIIFSNFGGTPEQNWTRKETLAANPQLKFLVDEYETAVKKYPAALDNFNTKKDQLLAKWAADTLIAFNTHKPFPAKPAAPRNPNEGAGGLYNAMINPLIPFAIKGVVWYQGESNRRNPKLYRTLFPIMINDWRKTWNQGEFPFLYVQVAPFKDMSPELREAQLLTLDKVSNIAMTVITDCGDSSAIHPANKQPVGNRLQLAARALAYNEKIEYSGPLYKGFEVNDNAIEITFTHVGKGLLAKDGDLTGFIIAGDDKKFLPAKAVIKGDKIVVSSSEVATPTAVRFGWADFSVNNFFNKDGLPASPFRTDVD